MLASYIRNMHEALQRLCLILADENFPSIERGQEFVLWCKNDKNLEVLKLTDETHIIELFREFRQEMLAQIMHLKRCNNHS